MNQPTTTSHLKGAAKRAAKNVDHSPLVEGENAALRQADAAGFTNPHSDPDHRATLFPPAPAGKRYRRFIKSFKMVEYSQLTDKNNRHADVDPKHCREVLVPLLERANQINFPIMGRAKTPVSFYTDHGHNRSWSSNDLWPGRSLPFLELRPEIYDITVGPSGSEVYTVVAGPEESLGEYLSEVRCNPGYKNKPYTKFCATEHLKECFKLDPTFHGCNPSRQFPTRNGGIFDKIMDLLHPEQFLNKGTRTQIYNRWKQGAPTSATTAQTQASRTNELAKLGWDQGLIPGKNGQMSEYNRETFKNWEWYDSKNNAYLGMTTSNGNKFKEKIFLNCIEAHCSNRILQSSDINLLFVIDKPSHVLANLETQRDNQVTEIVKVNTMLKTLGIKLRIKMVRFVKQLKDTNDTGRTVTV
jgi:hypothetical protein